jgi:hypothetical protein
MHFNAHTFIHNGPKFRSSLSHSMFLPAPCHVATEKLKRSAWKWHRPYAMSGRCSRSIHHRNLQACAASKLIQVVRSFECDPAACSHVDDELPYQFDLASSIGRDVGKQLLLRWFGLSESLWVFLLPNSIWFNSCWKIDPQFIERGIGSMSGSKLIIVSFTGPKEWNGLINDLGRGQELSSKSPWMWNFGLNGEQPT